MNLPNAITIIRILLIPLFLYKIIQGEMVFAAAVYLAAAISDGLDGLPEPNFHCAEMALRALHAAVQDAYRCAREPWKKLYR